MGKYREYYLKGRLSTADLLIKAACFVENKSIIFNLKGAHLN
jgi:hypothetical protein